MFVSQLGFAAFKVLIDPGHGGKDSGAVRGDAREADIVYKIASHLRDKIALD